MKFLTVEEVLELHDDIIKMSTGCEGVRDLGLLMSAIETPKAMMFGEYLHESIYDKAAAYLYHIVCNHAFIDGNKRTGSISAIIFLEMNDVLLEFDESEYEEMVCKVAQGQLKKNEISDFFKNNHRSK